MAETLLGAAGLAGELLARTLPFMVVGVLIAELIAALGVVDKVSFVARPITGFSHLRAECGASFLLAFGSPAAANAMLADYREKGFISKREMFLASLINSFPAILMHWRSMLPAILPLLGIIGFIYFLVLVLIGLVKTALVMLASRFMLPSRDDCELALEERKGLALKKAIRQSLVHSRKTIVRMIAITVSTMFAVCILVKVGAFDALASYLSSVGAYFPVPTPGWGIIAAQFGHSLAAYTVASGLLAAGEITGKGIILTLLIGGVLTSIVSIFRYLIPYYVGIFGPKTGLQLMLVSAGIRNAIVIIFVAVIALVC